MWQCVDSQAFWTNFVDCLKEKRDDCSQLTVDQSLVLFGFNETKKTDTGFDFILLHVKFFVYRCRINKSKPLTQCLLERNETGL